MKIEKLIKKAFDIIEYENLDNTPFDKQSKHKLNDYFAKLTEQEYSKENLINDMQSLIEEINQLPSDLGIIDISHITENPFTEILSGDPVIVVPLKDRFIVPLAMVLNENPNFYQKVKKIINSKSR